MTLRRTKIIATLGPATDRPGCLEELVRAGINVARMNFSHGSHDEHARRIREVRSLESKLGVPLGILQDLQGPKLRIGSFAAGSVMLQEGEEFLLTTRQVEGDRRQVHLDVPDILQDIRPGEEILLRDGLIKLEVVRVEAENIFCRVVDGGELASKSGIHLPVSSLRVEALTEKDRVDLDFGLEQGVDMVALSFVRSAGDIRQLKEILLSRNADIPVIAKIEKREALQDFDAILQAADGIMVARGDLGIESRITEVPLDQKMIIAKCNRIGKPVITATQMLESMISNRRPTRAEVADVANAIFDGTDATMLSGETAVGEHPAECVRMMHEIAVSSEAGLDRKRMLARNVNLKVDSITEAIGEATAGMASDLKVPAIITFTSSGYTARMICRFRPEAAVVAVTTSRATMRRLTISWGVYPLLADNIYGTDEMIANAVALAHEAGFVAGGDTVVVTAGVPIGVKGTTNLIKVHQV